MAKKQLKSVKLSEQVQTGDVAESVNGMTGGITIAQGSNVTVTKNEGTKTVTISATGGGADGINTAQVTSGCASDPKTTYLYANACGGGTTGSQLALGEDSCGNRQSVTFVGSTFSSCGGGCGLYIDDTGRAYYNGCELGSGGGGGDGLCGIGTKVEYIGQCGRFNSKDALIYPDYTDCGSGGKLLRIGTKGACESYPVAFGHNAYRYGCGDGRGLYIDDTGRAYYNGCELGSSGSRGLDIYQYSFSPTCGWGCNCSTFVMPAYYGCDSTLVLGGAACGSTSSISFACSWYCGCGCGCDRGCGLFISSSGRAYYDGCELGSGGGAMEGFDTSIAPGCGVSVGFGTYYGDSYSTAVLSSQSCSSSLSIVAAYGSLNLAVRDCSSCGGYCDYVTVTPDHGTVFHGCAFFGRSAVFCGGAAFICSTTFRDYVHLDGNVVHLGSACGCSSTMYVNQGSYLVFVCGCDSCNNITLDFDKLSQLVSRL